MNGWSFFAFIFGRFDTVFLVGVKGMAAAASDYAMPCLLAFVTIWIAGTTADELYGGAGGSDPLNSFLRKAVRASIVITATGAQTYVPFFAQFVLVDLPQEITSVVASAANVGGQPITANAFDNLLNAGWVGLVQIWNNVSGWSFKSALVGAAAGLEFVIGAIFIAVGFCMYMAVHFTLGLSVAVGALFVPLVLWKKTLPMANAWMATLICMVIAQVLIVALLTLLVTVETDILRQIVALNSSNGDAANDIAAQLHYLIEGVILFLMIGLMAYKVEHHARAMVGGGAAFISDFTSAAHSAISGGVSHATQFAGNSFGGGAPPAANSNNPFGNSGAGMRRVSPPGRGP